MSCFETVLSDKYLKKKIYDFVEPVKCLSCRKEIFYNKFKKDILDYNNSVWKDSINIYSNKNHLKNIYVCNWCYYYVWGTR